MASGAGYTSISLWDVVRGPLQPDREHST